MNITTKGKRTIIDFENDKLIFNKDIGIKLNSSDNVTIKNAVLHQDSMSNKYMVTKLLKYTMLFMSTVVTYRELIKMTNLIVVIVKKLLGGSK